MVTNDSAGTLLKHSAICFESSGHWTIVDRDKALRLAQPGGETAHRHSGEPLSIIALLNNPTYE